MTIIAIIAFAIVLVVLGVLGLAYPSRVRALGEKLGGPSWFSDRTVERSIRFSGGLALLMAVVLIVLLVTR